jgi:hypothetical protein
VIGGVKSLVYILQAQVPIHEQQLKEEDPPLTARVSPIERIRRGKPVLLSVESGVTESIEAWRDFLCQMTPRVLRG